MRPFAVTKCPDTCRPKPPNRTKPRKFRAADVARIWCHVRQSGVSVAQLQAEIKERCPNDADDCDCEKIRIQLRLLQTALAAATVALGFAIGGFAGSALTRILLRFVAGRAALEHLERASQALEDATDVLDAILRDGDWQVIIREGQQTGTPP